MAKRNGFWASLLGSQPERERFSLEELKHLHDVLQQCSIVTDANREVVVETLRSIAGEPPPCSPCCQKFFGKCSCNYRQAAMTKMQQWCDQCCAELMIWGDQHDPAYFDYFAENNLLHHFAQFLQQRDNRQGDVAKQVRSAQPHHQASVDAETKRGLQ